MARLLGRAFPRRRRRKADAAPPPVFEALEPRILLDAVNFRAPQTFEYGTPSSYEEVRAAEAVDLNEDGHADLLTFTSRYNGSGYTPTVRWRLNQGDGTFGSASSSDLPSTSAYNVPAASAVGDFDGDGHTDVIGVDSADGKFWFLKGAGDGAFTSITRVTHGLSSVLQASAADVNGDGKDDLLITGYYGAKLFLGNAAGTFTSSTSFNDSYPYAGQIGDVNEDGHPDILFAGDYGVAYLNLRLGNGDGTFQSPQTLYANSDWNNHSSIESFSLADFDNDGHLDLAERRYDLQSWNESRSFQIAYGNGNGTFGSYQTFHQTYDAWNSMIGPIAVDLNADGLLDPVWLTAWGGFNYALGQTGRTFGQVEYGPPADYSAYGSSLAFAAADFDGDGYDDLAPGAASIQQVFRVKPGIVRAGGPYNAVEGGGVTLHGIGDGTLEWDFDYDGSSFQVNATGASPTFSAGSRDDGDVTIAVRGLNGAGQIVIASGFVHIADVAPTLSISGSAEVEQGTTYTLSLNASDPGPDTITSWTIHWGDGNTQQVTGNPSSVTHSYSDVGDFTITASATNSDGTFNANSRGVSVFATGPRAVISGAPATADEGDDITLQGSVTNLVGGETVTYAWTVKRGQTTVLTGSAAQLLFSPSDEGQYTVNLAVTIDGLVREANKSITVSNVAPAVEITGLPTIKHVGAELAMLAVPADPGDDTFTYAWSVKQGQTVIASQTGANAAFNWTPANTGDYTLRVEVSDGDGGTGARGIVLTVVPALIILSTALYTPEDHDSQSPIATLAASHRDPSAVLTWEIYGGTGAAVFTINPDTGALRLASGATLNYEAVTSYTLNIRATDDEDPAHTATGTITVYVTNVNEAPVVTPATFFIAENRPNGTAVDAVSASDQDAGQTLTYSIVGGNAGGVFTINTSTGAITVADYTGLDFETTPTFNLTVRATDNAGTPLYGSATITIQLTDLPDTPVAVADTFTIAHDRTLTVSSASGGVLSNDVTIGGATLSATLIDDVATGTLTLQSNGTFTYTPVAGFVGQTSFTYRVSAPGVTGSTATVTLNVINHTPTAADQTYTAHHDAPLIVGDVSRGVLAGACDADVDALTAALLDAPAHGRVVLAADGTFVYTPEAGFVGADAFTYRVSDGIAWSAARTVTLGVANAAPHALGDFYRTAVDTAIQVSAADGVLRNDADPESDTLSVELVDAPQHSDVSLAADGSFVYTPDPGYLGTDLFTYTIADATRHSESAVVRLTIGTPSAPVAPGLLYRLSHGHTLTVDDPAEGVIAGVASPSSASVTALLVVGAAHGQLTLNSNGTFTYTAAAGYAGTDSFTFRAVAGDLQSDVTTAQIIVGNTTPFAVDAHYYARHGQPIVVTDPALGLLAFATDPDGDAMTIVLTGYPTVGLLLAFNADGTFNYVPTFNDARDVTFTWAPRDGIVTGASRSIIFHFTSDPPAPTDDIYFYRPGHALAVPVDRGVLANDRDLDGDTLTAQIVAQPARGTITFNANGSFTYTPTSERLDLVTFTYRVSDGEFTSDPVTVALIADDSVPNVTEDEYATLHGIPILKNADDGVLANDFDDDGDALEAVLVDAPLHGTVTLDADGGFLYAPAAGFAGTDFFTYAAWDSVGASETVRVTIEVVNSPPATIEDDYTASAGTTTTITTDDGVLANDLDTEGDTLTAQVVNTAGHGTLTLNANGSFTYTPTAGFTGADIFTYRAFDGAAWSLPTTVHITVTNAAPIALADVYEASHGRTLTVNDENGVLANDFDADEGATLTAALTQGAGHGTVTLNANGSFSYTPAAGFTGVDGFTYAVSDGAATSLPARVTILVGNAPPAAQDDTYEATEDAPLTVAAGAGVLANDTDADEDALAVTLVSGPAFGALTLNANGSFVYMPEDDFFGVDSFTYRVSDGPGSDYATATIVVAPVNDAPASPAIHFDAHANNPLTAPAGSLLAEATDADGDELTAVAATQPAHGTLTVAADGSFVYTPDAGYLGDDTFTFRVSDGDAQSGVVTVTITVGNATPVAASPSITVLPGVATTIPVSSGLVFLARDDDGDDLTVALVTGGGPAHGTLNLNASGSFTYTPDTGYTGADSFTYAVSDGLATSASATVTLLVTSSPVIAQNDEYTVIHDRTLAVAARLGTLWNDWEPQLGSLEAELVTDAAHGTVTLNADGSFTYTPDEGFVGDDGFTYHALLGQSVSNTASAVIHVTNLAPVGSYDNYRVAHDRELEVSSARGLLLGDYDEDGDTLIATLSPGHAPLHGMVETDPDGAFVYTPDAGYVGTDSFMYRVSDGIAITDLRVVTIRVENSAPADATTEFSVHHDTTLNGFLYDGSIDPDGDPLSVHVTNPPAHGQIVFSNGSITYVPDAGFAGTDRVTYRLFDGVTESRDSVIVINVWNAVPLAVGEAVRMSHRQNLPAEPPPQGFTLLETGEPPPQPFLVLPNLLANDFDWDGDSLSVIIGTQPLHGHVDGPDSGGHFTYRRTVPGFIGTDVFYYVVSDGVSQSEPVMVTVEITNEAPRATPGTYSTRPNQSITFDPRANATDPDGDLLRPTIIAQPGHGNVAESGTTWTYTPSDGFRGVDYFYYTVSDGSLTSAPVRVVVNVGGARIVTMRDSYGVVAGATLTVNAADGVLANDWADLSLFAGSSTLSAQVLSNVAHGTLSLQADGGFTYRPNPNYYGSDSFTYEAVVDGEKASAIVSIHIEPRLFELFDDDLYLRQNTSANPSDITKNVLENDDFPKNSEGLNDPANNPVASLVTQQTQFATFTLQPDGTFWFRPNPAWVGDVTVTYRVAMHGLSRDADIHIHVGGDKPQAIDDTWADRAQSMLVSTLLANDSGIGFQLNPATVKIAAQARLGTITLLEADGPLARRFVYTPNPGAYEDDSFSYTVEDSFHQKSNPALVKITGSPPVITAKLADDTVIAQPGRSVTINVLDNDELPAGGNYEVQIAQGPASGTAEISGDKHTITYTGDSAGEVTFTYKLMGVSGDPATVTVKVGKINHPPVAVPDTFAVNSGQSPLVSFTQLTANDTDPDDPDGRLVPYSFEFLDPPTLGAIVFGPSDENSGGFRFVAPIVTAATAVTLRYRVRDAHGEASVGTVTFNVSPANRAPTAMADRFVKIYERRTDPNYKLVMNVVDNDTDPDGDALTIVSFTYNGQVYTGSSDFAQITGDRRSIELIPRQNPPQGEPYIAPIGRLTYTITDGHGGQTTGVVWIDEPQDGPATSSFNVGPGAQEWDSLHDVRIRNIGPAVHAEISLHSVELSPVAGAASNLSYQVSVDAGERDGSRSPIPVNVTWTGPAQSLILEATGNIGDLSVPGDLAATSHHGSIGNLTGLTVEATAWGDIGNVTATERVHTIRSTHGGIGQVTAHNGRVGGVGAAGAIAGVSSNAEIEWISSDADVTGTISAVTFINSIESRWGSVRATITAGTYITRIYASLDILLTITAGADIGQIDARRRIDATIRAGGNISGVLARVGDICGNITAGYQHAEGSIDSVTAVGSIDAEVVAPTSIGSVSAGVELNGRIESGAINTVSARQTIDAHIKATTGGISSVSSMFNLTGAITAYGDISSVYADHDIKQITIESTHGKVLDVRAGGNNDPTGSGSIIDAKIVGHLGVGAVRSRSGLGHNGGISGNTTIDAPEGGIDEVSSSGGLVLKSIKARDTVGPVQAGVGPGTPGTPGEPGNPGDLEVEITATTVTVIRALTGSVKAKVAATGDIGVKPFTWWNQPLLYALDSFDADFTTPGKVAPITTNDGDIRGLIMQNGNGDNLSAGRDISATVVSRTGSIGKLFAGRDIRGSYTASKNIGPVLARRNVSGTFTATTGSIVRIVAGFSEGYSLQTYGSINATITAGMDIGAILANGSAFTDEAGTPIKVLADADPALQALTDVLVKLVADPVQFHLLGDAILGKPASLPIERLAASANGGNIQGSITAGGSITSITAGGNIPGDPAHGDSFSVTADTLGTVWARGDVKGSFTVYSGDVRFEVWGAFNGPVTAQGGKVTIHALGGVKGTITAKNAIVEIRSAGKIDVEKVEARSADISTTDDASILSLITQNNSFVTALGKLTLYTSPVGLSLVAAWGAIDYVLKKNPNLIPDEADAFIYSWTGVKLKAEAPADYLVVHTRGVAELDMADDARFKRGVFVLAKEGIRGYTGDAPAKIYSKGPIHLQSPKDINAQVNPGDAPLATSLNTPDGQLWVEGRNVKGIYCDVIVNIRASESFTTGEARATHHVNITVHDKVNAHAVSDGTILITAGGDVLKPSGTASDNLADISGKYGVVILTWGKLTARVQSTHGAVTLNAYQGVDISPASPATGSSGQTPNAGFSPTDNFSVAASGYIDIESWQAVKGTFISSGYINVFASGNVDATIDAGHDIAVEAWGTVSGSATGGVHYVTPGGDASSPRPIVTVTATLGVSAAIRSAGEVHVSTGVDFTGNADAGQSATVHAIGSITGEVHGGNDVQLYANRVKVAGGSSGSTSSPASAGDAKISSLLGSIFIQAFSDVTGGFTFSQGLNVIAGGLVNLHAGATGRGANVSITSMHDSSIAYARPPPSDQTASLVSINAPAGHVRVSASGDLHVYIIGAGAYCVPNDLPESVDVFAVGHARGDVGATSSVSVLTFEDVTGITAFTTDSQATLSIATDADLTGEFIATDNLEVFAGGNIHDATLVAGSHASAAHGNVSVSALGSIRDTRISTRKTAPNSDPLADDPLEDITPASVPAADVVWRDAEVFVGGTIQRLLVHAVRGVSVIADGGIQSITVTAGGNASVESATGGITGQSRIRAGAGASVAALGDISVTIRAGFADVSTGGDLAAEYIRTSTGDLSVYAAGAATGDFTSARDLAITAAAITASLYAEGDLFVLAGSTLNGTITSEGHASIRALGNVQATILADTLWLDASGDVEGSIQTTGGAASVTVAGSLIAWLDVHTDLALTVVGIQSGFLNVGHDATVVIRGHASGPITIGHSVTLTVLGNLNSSVHAAANAGVTVAGNINGTITAGGDMAVTAVGAISANLSAGAGLAVTAWGHVYSEISAGAAIVLTIYGSYQGHIAAAGHATVVIVGSASAYIALNSDADVSIGDNTFVAGSVGGDLSLRIGSSAIVILDVGGDASISALGPSATIDVEADGKVDIFVFAIGATVLADAGLDLSVFAAHGLTAYLTSTNGSISITTGDDAALHAHAAVDIHVTIWGDLFGDLESVWTLSVLASKSIYASLESAHDMEVVTGGNLASVFIHAGGNADLSAAGNVAPLGTVTGQSVSINAFGAVDADVTTTYDLSVVAVGLITGTFDAGRDARLISYGLIHNLTLDAGRDITRVFAGGDIDDAALTAARDILAVTALGDLHATLTAGDRIVRVASYGSILAGTTIAAGAAPEGTAYHDPTWSQWARIETILAWGDIAATVTTPGYIVHLLSAGDQDIDLSGVQGVAVGGGPAADRQINNRYLLIGRPRVRAPSASGLIASLRQGWREFEDALAEMTASVGNTTPGHSEHDRTQAALGRARGQVTEELGRSGEEMEASASHAAESLKLELRRAGLGHEAGQRALSSAITARRSAAFRGFFEHRAALEAERAGTRWELQKSRVQTRADELYRARMMTILGEAKQKQSLKAKKDLETTVKDLAGRDFEQTERDFLAKVDELLRKPRKAEGRKWTFEEKLNLLQDVLGLLGMLPVVGVIFDATNAAIYLWRGDYAMAALSAVSALPLLGDAIGAAAQGTRMALKVGRWAATRSEGASIVALMACSAEGLLLDCLDLQIGPGGAELGDPRVGDQFAFAYSHSLELGHLGDGIDESRVGDLCLEKIEVFNIWGLDEVSDAGVSDWGAGEPQTDKLEIGGFGKRRHAFVREAIIPADVENL